MRTSLPLLLLALAAPAAAQPADAPLAPPDTTLPEVSVVATREAVALREAPAHVTVLGPEALAATGARTVADVLEARAAVSIRRYGPGGLATLSTRGTGAAHTAVLLDGHRIADPQLGQLDLGLLPALLLERVELLHGAGSALYGTDGLGGVLNLVSARPGAERLEVAGAAGAYGERSLGGVLGLGIVGDASALVAAEIETAEGDFPYFDPNAGPDGSTLRREGADRRLASVLARLAYAPGPLAAHLGVWAAEAERGLPATAGAAAEGERQRDRHLRLWGGAERRFGWGSLRAGALLQRAELRYQNPALDLDEAGRTWLASAEAAASVLAGEHWLLGAGLGAGLASAEHPSLAESARETTLAAFAHATGRLGRLLLYPALRADLVLGHGEARPLSALSPRLGLNLQPVRGLPLRIKAGAGGAFRAPTFNDRFWQPGGNPDLRPERGVSADLGARLEARGLAAEVSAYALALRDQIVWQPVGSHHAPENLARTRTLGLEASLEGRGLRLGPVEAGGGAAYALTDARDRSRPGSSAYGRQLRYVPRHRLTLFASAALGLPRSARLGLDLGARLLGERPVRADGSLALPAALTLDGQLRLAVPIGGAAATLALAAENLTGARYELVRGYPMPPRHARLRLHLAF